MMKQFKKALSILCIIALLVSGIAMAFADEAVEAPAEEAPAAAEAPVEEAPAPQPVEEPAPQPAPEPAPQPEPQPEPEPVREEPAPQPEPEPVREEPAPQPEPEPVREEPAPQPEPEPVQEEPAPQPEPEPAQEEPAQQPETEPAQEEPATQPAQEEPVQQPAAEESSNIIEETPASSAGEEDENGLVEIDDGWGYVDPEVINENTPEITDEFKGIRNAEMHVGESLSDTVVFGEELVVTLRGSAYPTVTLKLYTAPGTTLNVKIDGKAVGFTPAESDDPSMNLSTYELTNTASRKREITFSTSDTASFRLTAEPKQTEVRNDTPETAEPAPAAEQPEGQTAEQPAETPAEDHTGNNTPAPEPTVELSVKTYDALKVGNSINDTLVGGQKARIQLKCGKNPSVTLTLKANPNDANVQIDGGDVQFTQVSEGTYTCKLENVAFRKFNITIMAKQALSFSVSASANTEAGETADEGETEENTEESAEAPAEESEEEPAEGTEEEPAEGTEEEPAEGTEEESAEGTEEEPAEGTEEEPAEGTDEEGAEGTEEEGAEGTEEEGAEGTEEEAAEGTEEEETEEPAEETESSETEEEGTEEEGAEENTETETEEISRTFSVDLPVMLTADSQVVYFGERSSAIADLSGLEEYDNISYRWFYSDDSGESWTEIEGANEPVYEYTMSGSNWYYRYKAVATITVITVVPIQPEAAEEIPSNEDEQPAEENEQPAEVQEPAAETAAEETAEVPVTEENAE